MAFINKRTFEIAHKFSEMYGTIPEDFFEVDESIAPAISLLNKKGYGTISSCSGHVFPELRAFRIGKNRKFKKEQSGVAFENMSLLDGMPYVMSIDSAYILFDKEYDFFLNIDGLKGFELKTIKTLKGNLSMLSRKYSASDGSFGKMREIINTMEFMLNWASELDDICGRRGTISREFKMNDLPMFRKSSLRTL